MHEQNEEFIALKEILADAADLIDLRAAKAEELSSTPVPIGEVKERLGLGKLVDGRESTMDEGSGT